MHHFGLNIIFDDFNFEDALSILSIKDLTIQ